MRFRLPGKNLLPHLRLRKCQLQRRIGCRENSAPEKRDRVSHSMIKSIGEKYLWRLDSLPASRQSLAFDQKTSMGLRVDRPELPMKLRQLKINRRDYKTEKE